MDQIQVLAQVAADYARVPVIYEYEGLYGRHLKKRPQTGSKPMGLPLRLDLEGAHRDLLVGAVKRGMEAAGIEYAEANPDGVFQVTVWKRDDVDHQVMVISSDLTTSLLRALAKLEGLL
jgi:hypothetical protein